MEAALQQIVILSGSGRFADPWHDLDRTSQCVATALRDLPRIHVSTRTDIDGALADLDDVDLLVLNTGVPTQDAGSATHSAPPSDVVERARQSIDGFLSRGGSVLALHSSAASWSDYPRLAERIGARWVPDTSWHPPQGAVSVVVTAHHPVTDGMSEFRLIDERYTDLELAADPPQVVLASEDDGVAHPLLLVRDDVAGRAAYLALGHDEGAYQSPELRQLVARLALWLLHRGPVAAE